MRRSSEEALNAPFVHMKKRRQPQVKLCDKPDCRMPAACRAPKSREGKDFYHFCTDHAREYNRSWNYFKGMSAAEAEHSRRADILWNRPTFRFGQAGLDAERRRANPQQKLKDDFGFWQQRFAHQQDSDRGPFSSGVEPQLSREQRNALATLGLEAPVSAKDVKERFKFLARKLHPDINPDNPDTEDKLKAVNAAYQLLKSGLNDESLFAQD